MIRVEKLMNLILHRKGMRFRAIGRKTGLHRETVN